MPRSAGYSYASLLIRVAPFLTISILQTRYTSDHAYHNDNEYNGT